LPDLTQAARRDHLVSASGSQPQAHRDLRLDYWITTSITAWRDAVSPINALLLGSAISALAALRRLPGHSRRAPLACEADR
jgi:hypothetical protein